MNVKALASFLLIATQPLPLWAQDPTDVTPEEAAAVGLPAPTTEPSPAAEAPATTEVIDSGDAPADPALDAAGAPPPASPATTPPSPELGVKQATPPPAPAKTHGMSLLLGGGASVGAFFPVHVNNYIENWQNSQGDIVIRQSGETSMLLYMVPRLTATFAPIEYLQLQAVGELGWSPKIAVVTGARDASQFFNFMRFSGGALVNGNMPLTASGRFSLFVGAGAFFHYMTFESYAAAAPGFRGQFGGRYRNGRFAADVFIAYDYVDQDTGKPMNSSKTTNADGSLGTSTSAGTMHLNYSGLMVGMNAYFDVTG
jgi:hypothetical protein